MVLRLNLKKFIISLAIPLFIGGLSAFIIRNDVNIYNKFNNPPLSPPSWVFPVVWTILYALMGISLYLVWNKNIPCFKKRSAIILFSLQLILNFIWAPVFFILQNFLLSFIILVFMWILTLGMIIAFYKISKPAGILQIPYIIWLSFAAYLNYGVYLLN